MKVYTAEHIRNVALISHVGAGKTSLIDAALYDSGAVTRQGKVDEGSSIGDHDPDELKRRMTLHAKVLPVEWKNTKINFSDTPGYADFVGEVKAALRVADAVLVVVTAEKGVEVGTELTWNYADEILSVIKQGTRTGQLIPVLSGSTSKNIGVQTLLDAIADYLPNAADALPEDTQAFGNNLSMFVFKTAAAQVGTISNFRIYTGTLKPDMHVYNLQTKADERIGQLITPRGKMQESATEIPAGDFGAVAKLANTHTGDTLSSNKDAADPLEPVNFPEPCYTVAVFPKSKADLDKMSNALGRVVQA